jgi:hypothetical protein
MFLDSPKSLAQYTKHLSWVSQALAWYVIVHFIASSFCVKLYRFINFMTATAKTNSTIYPVMNIVIADSGYLITILVIIIVPSTITSPATIALRLACTFVLNCVLIIITASFLNPILYLWMFPGADLVKSFMGFESLLQNGYSANILKIQFHNSHSLLNYLLLKKNYYIWLLIFKNNSLGCEKQHRHKPIIF